MERLPSTQGGPPSTVMPARSESTAGNACLTALVGAMLALTVFLLLAGIAIGRIGSWFEFNPFGLFAEPETRIDDSRTAVVTQMQSLGRLETMNYTIEKVIEAEKSGNALQDIFFGDRILLIASGQVIAGVDLTRLNEDSVEVTDDNVAIVTLPPSEIFVAALNNEETRVYDRERGLLSRGDSQLETRARQAAERSILEAACQQGILDQAANEASTQVQALLRLLEFSEVRVTAPVGTCPPAES